MTEMANGERDMTEGANREALKHEEEAFKAVSQWAQERLDNFLLEIENSDKNPKLLKISYVISRHTSVDAFSGKNSDIDEFVKKIIGKIDDSKVMEGISDTAGKIIYKLFDSASGSSQTERFYKVTFDELGGLNRLDAFLLCYRFASSEMINSSRAVIVTCVVRSAASMVDDNAYRVVLTNSTTLPDNSRVAIADHMIEVAKLQQVVLDDNGKTVKLASALLEERAKLAAVIGQGVASSEQHFERKNAKTSFKVGDSNGSAESHTEKLAASTNTLAISDEQEGKQIDG